MLVGAVNGAIGVAAGALAIGGRIIAAVSAGALSAFNTDGEWYNKLISGVLTAAITFGGSFIDGSAINGLAEFVTNFTITGLFGGAIDLLSTCINSVASPEVDMITVNSSQDTKLHTKQSTCGGGGGGKFHYVACIK